MKNIVKQLNDAAPVLKTIVIDVHNVRGFKDLSATPARQLRTVLENLMPELDKYGMVPVDATYDTAIEFFNTL